eukprot:TRINITY_DN9677_c0_g1_i1.p1 TRINITY_DN9677_c0_g1~~TRINITY_DN9677_c0_g1_i1.p1  ORF type:complete len:884 (+),score=119.58 TRINITY_DN9677_c0_g1_i1:13-2664(+)
MFDGSSDLLVNFSITDLLFQLFEEKVDQNFILVVDDYHVLKLENKKQLCYWCKSKNIKLILICNRYEDHDSELFESLKIQPKVIKCRGSLNRFFESTFEWSTKKTKFFVMWYRLTRNLFGEELLSRRIDNNLENIYHKSEKKADVTSDLVELLRSKVPTLAQAFCVQLVNEFLTRYNAETKALSFTSKSIHDLEEADIQKDIDFKELKPIQILSKAALINTSEKNASYPEFAFSKDFIKKFYMYHPVYKIVAWIDYMCSYMNVNLNDEQLQKLQDSFLSSRMIDLSNRFPMFIEGLIGTSIRSCEVAYLNTDFMDLQELKNNFERGFSINWKLAEKRWRKENITDLDLFDKLARKWQPSLTYINELNLRSLLRQSTKEHKIATIAVSLFEPRMYWYNAYYVAAWKLYCDQRLFTEPLESIQYQNYENKEVQVVDEKRLTFFPNKKFNKGIDLFNLFQWASIYGFNMFQVESPETFEKAFKEDLTYVCQAYYIISSKTGSRKEVEDKIIQIFSHAFAPLLDVGKLLSYEIGVKIAISRYPPLSKWPRSIKNICSIYYGKGNSGMLQELESTEFWPQLLVNNYFHTKEGQKLLVRILDLNLSQKWQETILYKSKGLIIPDECATVSVIKNFEAGLRSVYQHKKNISIHPNKFYKKLQRAKYLLFPTISNPILINRYHIVFVVERSTSMAEEDLIVTEIADSMISYPRTRLGVVYYAISKFIEKRSQMSIADSVSLIAFDKEAKTILRLEMCSFSLKEKISDCETRESTTRFSEAFNELNSLLQSSANENLNTMVIFITDGVSVEKSYLEILEEAFKHERKPFHFLAVPIGKMDISVLQQMTHCTSPYSSLLKNEPITDGKELCRRFEKVAENLSKYFFDTSTEIA